MGIVLVDMSAGSRTPAEWLVTIGYTYHSISLNQFAFPRHFGAESY